MQTDEDTNQAELNQLIRAAKRTKRKSHRRNTYRPEFAERARKIALLGAVDTEIAKALGISINSVTRWKKRYPEFGEAIAEGKRDADVKIAGSLFRLATGYTYTAHKVVVVKGEATTVSFEKHQPPDVRACMFWLRNRRPDLWSEKLYISPDTHSAVPEALTPEQEAVLKRIARIRAEAEKASTGDRLP